MPSFQQIARIEHRDIRSLVWRGDELVDWASGGVAFKLDGTTIPQHVYYAYKFDAACSSHDGKYVVIYARLGTKGVLLHEGKVVRELNRSYYQAEVYEYPVCFAKSADGRDLLIHCPDDYNHIEIEDCETGERLTQLDTRNPSDFFQSRFATNGSGEYFMSAGWVWHPFGALLVFSLEEAIANPKHLDFSELFPKQSSEIASASFYGNDRIVVSTSDETFSDGDFGPNELRPNTISWWNLKEGEALSEVSLTETAGTLMPIDERYVLGLFGSPKIIDTRTGEIVARFAAVDSGKQDGCIIHHIEKIPVTAIDFENKRLAIADADGITVLAIVE